MFTLRVTKLLLDIRGGFTHDNEMDMKLNF